MIYKLVPKQLTDSMSEVLRNEHCVYQTEQELYNALLAAAPAAPAELDPVAYMAQSGTCVSAEDVSYTPNWTDYYTTPLVSQSAAAAVISAKDAEIAVLKATERDYWALNVVSLKEQLAATEKERDKLILAVADHVTARCELADQNVTAIAELKDLQKMEAQQLRKIHPLDFPLEVFLADLTTRPANIIRAELAGYASYAGTGTFDIEPPFTVRHLCMFSRSEMRKWPNFGRKCLNEVEEMLRARGLQLWENHDERSLRLLREHKEYFK